MPPERTTQSFLEYASAPGLYSLSSTGPGSQASLERGRACLVCRTRKVKCDGVKPACGACCRSARAHGEDPGKIVCDFTEPPRRRRKAVVADKDQTKGTSPQEKEASVEELKQRIAELEARLSNQPEETLSGLPDLPTSNVLLPATSSMTSMEYLTSASLDPFDRAGRSVFQASDQLPDISAASFSHGIEEFNFPIDLLSSSLFLSGWPQDLPTADLMDRLFDVYFSRDHIMSNVIAPERFRARMALPPSHANFPLDTLIHAILGFAGDMVPPSFFDSEPRYWPVTETFSEFHVNKATQMYQDTLVSNQSRKMMDLCQAIILLSSINYVQANFGKVWFQLAAASRLAVFLGLNHVRAAVRDSEGTLRNTRRKLAMNMLPPTDDSEELYERQMTFYAAFISDRIASISSTKEPIMDLNDITTLIPSLEGPKRFPKAEDLFNSPLTHHNPNFFIAHPTYSCGVFQLGIKAILLTGQAQDFVSRAPEPIGEGLPRWTAYAGEQSPDLRRTPAFQRIESNIKQFAASLPREYTAANAVCNPTGYVGTILMVITMPHVAMMILHERFCAMNGPDQSMTTCVEEAKQVLTIVYMLFNTSFDISRVNPFLNSLWLVVGRTLVREIALRQLRQDREGTETLTNDVRLLTAAMHATQCNIGKSTAKSLSAMLLNPQQCLPDIGDPRLGITCGGLGFGSAAGETIRVKATKPNPFIDSPLESPSHGSSSVGTDADRFQNLSPTDNAGYSGASVASSLSSRQNDIFSM